MKGFFVKNVIIIGSGPAGLTAAIYCARAALTPLVISGPLPGGQLTTTTIIENWPGHPTGIDGNELMNNMREQAKNMGARFSTGTVSRLEKHAQQGFLLELESQEAPLHTKSIIVATGAMALTLPLPQKDALMGRGLSTCAVCDGFFYKNKKVAVVGGGDSAIEEATYLAKLASHVTLIHRRDHFRASKAMQERLVRYPNIEVRLCTEVLDTIADESGLTGIVLQDSAGQRENRSVDGLFMAIGHKPATGFLSNLVKMDDQGYIETHQGTYTSTPGIFAAGDVEDHLYRQAITAAGRGCQAALQVEKYLESLA